METINDRNRHWFVNPWGHFAVSLFPAGRAYARFLMERIPATDLSVDLLGRLAQNALYFHDGPEAPIPPLMASYSDRLAVSAGIRKTRPWVIVLSGLKDTPPATSQWFLERQSNLSVFHEKTGLIITGAGSRGQPELATVSEIVDGREFHLPLDTRLDFDTPLSRLALAFHRFFVTVEAPPPTQQRASFQFAVTGRGPAPGAVRLTLQLVLKPGETLETGTGARRRLDGHAIDLSADELGGAIHHAGWRLTFDAPARLVWPVYPYNPYRNAPETHLNRAVAALSFPLTLHAEPGRYVRPRERIISVQVLVNE